MKKLCLICAAGGHLTQMRQMEHLWKYYDYFFVTQKKPITKYLKKVHKTYYIQDPNRNPIPVIKCFIDSWKLFRKEKPDVIITTGAGIAIPMFIIGKLFGKKLIAIESVSRVFTPSLTGKILYNIADLFLVQWPTLLKKYGPKAKYGGRVF